MKLSTKGRYAMVALADLALEGGAGHTSLTEISRRQNISLAYLEQLFVKLRPRRHSGFCSRRKRRLQACQEGGDIKVSDILQAVDESLDALEAGFGMSGNKFGHASAVPYQ